MKNNGRPMKAGTFLGVCVTAMLAVAVLCPRQAEAQDPPRTYWKYLSGGNALPLIYESISGNVNPFDPTHQVQANATFDATIEIAGYAHTFALFDRAAVASVLFTMGRLSSDVTVSLNTTRESASGFGDPMLELNVNIIGPPAQKTIHLRLRGEDEHITIAAALLAGIHNVENMMAAAAVGFVSGLSLQSMQQALVRFSGLKHRMELVDEIRGVSFYNDSKATNVGAVVKSLESLPAPLVPIAGGKDKGGSYAPLQSLLRQKVKLLVLLGEARERMRAELGGEVETVMIASLDEAVRTAFSRSEAGDTVLFSPACSSFDMFTS